MNVTNLWQLLRQTADEWMADSAPRLGAALAFYSVLSVAPLLVIVLAVASMVFGAEAAHGALVHQIDQMVGREGAEAIEEMIRHAQQPAEGTFASVLGILTLLLGASGVFGELQGALNTIWKVKAKDRGVWGMIQDRFLSFAMVFGTAFLLLISLVLSALLQAVGAYFGRWWPEQVALAQVLELTFSLGVTTILFALIFKVVPDTPVAWKDVLVGALLTAILFAVGKYLLGLYLGRGGLSTAYGAAGSLVVLVVWIYYSAQILFFGAEFTHVYAKRFGSQNIPVHAD